MSSVPGSSKKRVLVAGGTGLVGKQLVRLLAARSDVDVTALVRRAGSLPDVTERVFDFDDAAGYAALATEPFDLAFSCMGTTRAKAGSDAAFRRVDLDYPAKVVAAVKGRARAFALVSSVGAENRRGLYLKTKAELEDVVVASGMRWIIARPSFLVGDRAELRVGEKIGLATVAPMLSGLGALSKSMKKYAPIDGVDVARALCHGIFDTSTSQYLEGSGLFDAAKAYDSASTGGARRA